MVLRPRNGISLCAGAGGLDLGIMLAEPGYHTRCFVEWEEHPRAALIAGQRAGYFAPAPIWDDVTTFDARPFRGSIDLVAAGYPCQPFSAAGQRKGASDERHLWPDVGRVLDETDADWGFFENVAGHISLGLETVLRDLWDMGRTPAVGLFSSGETEGAHERQRVFILAHRNSEGGSADIGEPNAGTNGWDDAGWGGYDVVAQRQSTKRRCEQPAGSEGRGRAGYTGSGANVEDAGRTERRAIDARGHDLNRDNAGRQEGDGWFGEPEPAMGHAAGIGRGEGRPEHELRSGRNTVASASGELADTSGAGPQGRERRGSLGERHRTPAHGSVAERGRPWISPPGPSDAGAWGYVIRMAPDLAPSLAFRDIVSRANDLAAMVAEGRVAEAQAQSDLRRMADALAHRPRALKLLGNGVDPLVAGYAFRTLGAAHGLRPLDLEATR